ncbi:hypothetical protein RUM44_011399 [Polyplax serrata]|uniref:Uncharacterized protein n=1 Tax=Polyplax serrata TaxID=468196 RepID=A0ABR1APX2_POLSC
MWNIFTWLKPYAIAASETVRDFFTKAQEIQNQLYVQARATNAFSWIPRLFGFSASTKLEGPPRPSHQPGGFPDAAKLPALKPQKGGFQLKPVGKD